VECEALCHVGYHWVHRNCKWRTKNTWKQYQESIQLILGYGLGFDSRRRLGIFLFTTVSRPALGPTQPPISWLQGTISLGVKRPVSAADHSPPSSAEVKNAWSYTSIPQYVIVVWCLVKHRDNFTFTLQVIGTSHIIRKVLQSETWSLSGGVCHWFKRSARGKETCDKRRRWRR
jgi:hypothetical protein